MRAVLVFRWDGVQASANAGTAEQPRRHCGRPPAVFRGYGERHNARPRTEPGGGDDSSLPRVRICLGASPVPGRQSSPPRGAVLDARACGHGTRPRPAGAPSLLDPSVSAARCGARCSVARSLVAPSFVSCSCLHFLPLLPSPRRQTSGRSSTPWGSGPRRLCSGAVCGFWGDRSEWGAVSWGPDGKRSLGRERPRIVRRQRTRADASKKEIFPQHSAPIRWKCVEF